MAKAMNADPKRMYSWWWDSHISPKNSKWLQENLQGTKKYDLNEKIVIWYPSGFEISIFTIFICFLKNNMVVIHPILEETDYFLRRIVHIL